MTTDPAGVLDALRRAGHTVGAAESLTGGLVTARLTDVPGSSEMVRGGVVSYATEVKVDVLGVPAEVVSVHGVVSQECAEAMADGARRVLGADWGVATTGVAGPGPSDGVPAGTVHVAVSGPGERPGESVRAHRLLHVDGSRAQVREASVEAVLHLLHEALEHTLSGSLGTVGVRSQIDPDDGSSARPPHRGGRTGDEEPKEG